MSWLLLLAAGFFEIVWAAAMKLSEGFTRPLPVAVVVIGMALSVGLLALAMRDLPLGTAYAVWTGIGAAGAFLFGIVFLGEPLTMTRIAAVSMITGGIILMKLS
ncbi:multidrug efflux SMR transporter [Sutterella sp.]|uniref:DMT family transporter n=1 Tax=Sutterella sp. TaxID=1981025 RepID=UPI0026E0A0CD|nr:multidrug efflux SMR transporter [Sutterella sp.]MDO5532030.1 multidrug efflux SMR transporter [Sutterella sp.]